MPAERFFLDDELMQGTRVEMEGVELHHLAHVMRIKIGEEVELVNGRGSLAKGKVTSIEKRRAVIEVVSCEKSEVGAARFVMGIPLMRPSKLEWVVEKGTELGADAFWIYPADGSEKEGLSDNQLERLRYIAISAMKQSGRLDLPAIRILSRFEDLFSGAGTYLFGDTSPSAPLILEVRFEKIWPLVFITGPEKGFSSGEVKQLQMKAKGVRIHKNILRAETAPIAALPLLSILDRSYGL